MLIKHSLLHGLILSLQSGGGLMRWVRLKAVGQVFQTSHGARLICDSARRLLPPNLLLAEDSTLGTGKPSQVSLVEPVAYRTS